MNRRLNASVLLLVLCGAASAQDSYGVGSPGPGGIVPTLTCPQAWMGNASFGYSIANGVGGGNALLGISLQPASFSFANVNVLISPTPSDLILLIPITLGGVPGSVAAGSAFFPLPLTFMNPAFAGFVDYAQVFVDDPTNPGNLAASAGLRAEITMPPQIFVGTSVGGSLDPYNVVSPVTNTVVETGGNNFTNNVTDAVFARGGLDLFVASSITNSVSHGDRSTSPTTWSTVYTGPGATYGLGYDPNFKRLYTLTGVVPPGTTGNQANFRELVAIDADPASATYGQQLATTTGLAGGFGLERWALSPSGRIAAVPGVYLSPGPLKLVDTDPTSPNYMQVIVSTPCPSISGLVLASSVAVTPDDEWVTIAFGGLGAQQVGRFHVPTLAWVDFDVITPGVQHIQMPQQVMNRMAQSRDGSFIVATDQVSGGPLVRVDFTPTASPGYVLTPYLAGSPLLVSANGPSISPDARFCCFTALSPARLVIFDLTTATVAANISLVGITQNVYTTEWY